MRLRILFVLISAMVPAADGRSAERPHDFARWERAIARFEEQDRISAPPKEGVVFVGSSSVRLWDLARSFPDHATINRGFGGSEIVDSTHFAERLIVPHEPRVVVLYAGDNDLARGRLAEEVAGDFREFVRAVRARLPKSRIVFIGIKPSIARWKQWETMQRTNQLIRSDCAKDESLAFVDVAPAMLGDDGLPRPELFASDGLHLSGMGYAVWAERVGPHLGRPVQAPAPRPSEGVD
ncbi:MAG: SGNH/GDSL hydrolase family protein [Planctomycetales bacterium]